MGVLRYWVIWLINIPACTSTRFPCMLLLKLVRDRGCPLLPGIPQLIRVLLRFPFVVSLFSPLRCCFLSRLLSCTCRTSPESLSRVSDDLSSRILRCLLL